MSAPFMQLYVADYLGDTRHLTTEQHGAYLLILMTMWRSDGRLPNDPKKLARITACNPSRWAKIAPEVMEFFDVQGGEITNARLVLELEKAEEKSIKRAAAGALGGKANSLKYNKPGEANAEPSTGHSSEPEPEERKEIAVFGEPKPTRVFEEVIESPEDRPKPWEADPDFAAFWSAATDQGRKRSSRAQVWPEWRKARKTVSGAGLASAMSRYVAEDEDAKRTGGPGLHLWLKASRFEHWLVGASTGIVTLAAIFDGPAALRDSVAKLLGESFAATWIDSCRWNPKTRTLLARNAFALSKLNDDLGTWMRQKDVRAAVFGAEEEEPV